MLKRDVSRGLQELEEEDYNISINSKGGIVGIIVLDRKVGARQGNKNKKGCRSIEGMQ